MKPVSGVAVSILVVVLVLCGCAQQGHGGPQSGWITLLDGAAGLDNWNRVGDANWRIADGVVQADQAGRNGGYLVSKASFRDLMVRAEFWVSADANSGVFIRCTEPANIAPTTSYEVNIFDRRPDPSYGTGAIVEVAKVATMPRAGGRWNTLEIVAQGERLSVTLNNVKTVEVRDSRYASGPIALQYAGGLVKFRKVQVKPL